MKADDLLNIIGEADDKYIDSAKQKASPGWRRWIATAAAILAVIILLPSLFSFLFGPRSGAGSSGDLSYMIYRGPILPMSIQGNADGISARRNVNFDFSSQNRESLITDTYTLTNESGEDKTMTLLYPYSGGLNDPVPEIAVNGAAVEISCHPGPYRFGYQGAYGSKNPDAGSIMPNHPEQFEDYADLLADTAYMEAALDELPSLDQTAYVYRLSNYVYSGVENPMVGMEFYADPTKTQVFNYGMNGFSHDSETGFWGLYNSGIRPSSVEDHPEDSYVIILGEDLKDYTLQGYRNGMSGLWEQGHESPNVSCTVTRYETTLAALFSELGLISEQNDPERNEMILGLTAELLQTYGALSDQPAERLDTCDLNELLSEVYTVQRVSYLSFSVTIPAGASITVEAVQVKQASQDATGPGKDRDGYDLATRLGSSLHFTEQSASISGYENIKIVDQNFGFKPGRGITEVTLDLNEPHYWLVVRQK
ncbi:MAG: hypothetical protein E7464_00705 [Ruminococcaceae bacterium]|nr:hypothetical protein [Oscillospiraceae bacterium]